ncbi:MAG: bifunctional precorrin-2 dehydrogenase/sirohydrochlorin ferrochelatase, partial [Candidatus Eremiobacteraeota bacterium]|nr:bifunctional precorrin-2 dehydrogenase/sirohydrochlorin ferrochelatase [Candidatus Eremiobacteraeota bacterium]
MPSLPINLQISERLATIIGGGKVALRKAVALRAAGARVRIVAPQIEPELAQLAGQSTDALRKRP